MTTQIPTQSLDEIIYPERDGQPMSDNTIQFSWITTLKSNLDWLYAKDSLVFVAGDLLWYPLERDNKTRQAPDVMVVFGRPKGDRGSYKQWLEDNIPPQVVFEILSPGNTPSEMTRKLLFYQRYGVEEYYVYDPQQKELSGCLRNAHVLEEIENLDNWLSPRLGIRFSISSETGLELYYPDGQPFTTYIQERERAEKLAAKLRELGIDPEQI